MGLGKHFPLGFARVFAFLIVSLIVAIPLIIQSTPASADGDLVAWWKLDEGSGTSATDSSGNSNTGTLSNVTYTTNVPPDVLFDDPYAARFDSGASGRKISTPVSLNNYTQFTMTGWIYPTNPGTRMSLFGQNDIFEFGFTDSDTIICYTAKGEVQYNFTPGSFNNAWHHITCLASTTELIMYVDGDDVASVPIALGSFGSSGDNFSIGAGVMDGGTQGPFIGDIDDVRVYNRALTPEEMNALGTGSSGPTNGPAVAITSPTTGATNSWNPSVNWDNADDCEYRFNSDSYQALDCSLAGSDIPAPTQGANITLSIRGTYDSVATPGEATVQFTYDTTNPSVDVGENIQTNSSFAFSEASASDATSGIDTYEWSKQSGPGTITFSDASALNPSVTNVSLDGTYVVRLTVTDNAGNSAFDDFTLIWDTTSPSIDLLVFPDLYSNSTSATFEFSASESVSTPVTYSCKIDELSFNSCSSPLSYSDLAEGEHTVTIRAIDSVGNMETSDAYTWTVDLTAPVITRTGSANVTVVQGEPYLDEGASAIDSVDGTITDDIVTTDPVDSDVVGQYTVRFNVLDRAGNSALEVTRTVNVVSNADLNDDGTADAIQEYVGVVSGGLGNAVVVVDDDCSVDDVSVQTESENDEQDMEFDYPKGLMYFETTCPDNGRTMTVKMFFYGAQSSNLVARKYDSINDVYFDIPNAFLSDTTIDGQSVVILDYVIEDGGPLDMDGEVNGSIIDPAGLAVEVTSSGETPAGAQGSLPATGSNVSFLVLAGLIFLCAGFVLVRIGMRSKFELA